MSLTRVIGAVAANQALPQLDYHALRAAGVHVPEFIEGGVDGDFSFDLPDPDTFISRVGGARLDVNGKDYALADNVAGKYLVIASGSMNGLPGPTSDASEMTYAGLWNYRGADEGAVKVWAGTADDQGGEFLGVNAGGDFVLTVRGYSSNITLTKEDLNNGGIYYQSDRFVFVAATSRIHQSGETEHTLFVGASTPLVAVGTGTKVLSSNKLAVGNAYISQYDDVDVRCGRFLSASRSASTAELAAMYMRAKVIAERRGMTVF